MPIQTTESTAQNTYVNKTFYDRKLLETAKTKFCYANYGQKRNIPKNSGKTVEYRRWTLFNPDPKKLKLTEGVTPESQALKQTKVEATIEQYGAHVLVSDVLEMTAYDEVIADSAELIGEQLGTAIDWVTRDALVATTSVQYAGGNVSRVALTGSDKLTVAEVRKAVKTLKKNKARQFSNGRSPHFVCICSPDATYDLQSDADWKDVAKYQNAEAIYSGEIGRLYGVVFVESTEAPIAKQSVLNAVNAATSSSTMFVLKNDPTEAEVDYLSTGGNKIKVGSTEYTLASTGSYVPTTKTVKLTASASLSADAIVYSEDAAAPDSTTKAAPDVHQTLVFGADAYGVIDVEGSGALQTIIKEAKYNGSEDPLNQRSSIAGVVKGYAAKILQPLWVINIEHCVS